MGIGPSGQNGEPALRTGHVDEEKIHGQEVATILLLLMGGLPALAMVVKLEVLCFSSYDILYTNLFN